MKRLLLVVTFALLPTAVFATYSDVKLGALMAGNALSTNRADGEGLGVESIISARRRAVRTLTDSNCAAVLEKTHDARPGQLRCRTAQNKSRQRAEAEEGRFVDQMRLQIKRPQH